jgi:ribosomal protein L40E
MICSACSKGNNALKDCGMEGCGGKRAGESKFCNPCLAQKSTIAMSCFMCGADTTRDKSNLRRNKAFQRQCKKEDNMECFVLCNAYKGGVRGERCRSRRLVKKMGNSNLKHAEKGDASNGKKDSKL